MSINTHETTIHTRCPYAPIWDYYTVTIKTKEFIRCEEIQRVCDEVRGREMSQEDVFKFLRANITNLADITLEGRHGQNGKLVVSG